MPTSLTFLRKLTQPGIMERVLRERFAEPLHLNILSVFVAIFGNFQGKVYFDLIIRQHNAFCMLRAAKRAKELGFSGFTAIEFGVANGAGLLNMAAIAAEVTKATGIAVELVGFDSGKGMPEPQDYRDHPDMYGPGDFPMQDFDSLRKRLPPASKLIIGDVAETVPAFLSTLRPKCPIGYVVLDVDYYSSSVECLKILDGEASQYLPETLIYADDVADIRHNPWQGEHLAIEEFTQSHAMRKIHPYSFLKNWRLFKKATWLDHIHLLQVLDHPIKQSNHGGARVILGNPYLTNLPD